MIGSTDSPRRSLRPALWASLALAMLVMAAGFPGTMARWADATTMAGGTLTAGQLDLTLDGALSGAGGTTTDAAMSLAGMAPGESLTRTLTVANAGDVALSWTLRGSSVGPMADRVQVLVWLDSTSTGNTGTSAAGDRRGTCATGGGATQAFGWAPLGSSTVIVGTPRHLAPSGSRQLCVGIRLDPTTPSARQGQGASVRLTVDGEQEAA